MARTSQAAALYLFEVERNNFTTKGQLTPCLRPFVSRWSGLRGGLNGLRRFVSGVRESRMAVDLSMPVLVVDDYSTMIRIIRNLLKQLGFENIDDASDGSAALNKMRGKKYGPGFSDWILGQMAGCGL